MNIILGKTTDDKTKINKTMTSQVTLNGTLKQDCSIITPVITIEFDNPAPYNYARIPGFGRYYYIIDAVNVRNNIWRIHLKTDVLKSFANQIMAQTPIIERTSDASKANMYINDGTLATDTRTQHIYKTFQPVNGFNPATGKFVLVTAGGGITT